MVAIKPRIIKIPLLYTKIESKLSTHTIYFLISSLDSKTILVNYKSKKNSKNNNNNWRKKTMKNKKKNNLN